MKRLAIAMLALAVLAAAACAPPPPGKGRLDLWLVSHVTVAHEDLVGDCAQYRAAFKQIVLDDACIAPFPPEVREFLYYHEAGHAVDHQLWNFMRGPIGVGTEQIAQCVAEVALGYSIVYTSEQVDLGYWDCPPDQVEYFRQKMIEGGVW